MAFFNQLLTKYRSSFLEVATQVGQSHWLAGHQLVWSYILASYWLLCSSLIKSEMPGSSPSLSNLRLLRDWMMSLTVLIHSTHLVTVVTIIHYIIFKMAHRDQDSHKTSQTLRNSFAKFFLQCTIYNIMLMKNDQKP